MKISTPRPSLHERLLNAAIQSQAAQPLTRKRHQVRTPVRVTLADNFRKLEQLTVIPHSILYLTLTYGDMVDKKTVMARIAWFRAHILPKIGGSRWISVQAFQRRGRIHHHLVIQTNLDLCCPSDLNRVQSILCGKAMKNRFGRIDFKRAYGMDGLCKYFLKNWSMMTVPVEWGKFRCYSCGGAKITDTSGRPVRWYVPVRREMAAPCSYVC